MKKTQDITFGIVIPTYYRKDKSTKKLIEKCFNSILNQTYENWIIYLIGDDYEKKNEFFSYSYLFPNKKKINLFNKSVSERKFILDDKEKLWAIGF